jgi:hypothetical protein
MTVRAAAIVLALGAGSAVLAQPTPPAPPIEIEPVLRTVLTTHLRFSDRELDDVRHGRVAKHGLPSRAPGEIAVTGAVRIGAPKAAFFARVRDIAQFKNGPEVLQIARFSRPPVLDDLAALTVTEDDFDARSCHIGDCGIRLPAASIERFAREIDYKAPDAPSRISMLFKQILLEVVTAYASGAGQVTQYDDGSKPIRPNDEFEGILSAMPEIGALMPALPDHLRRFTSNPVPDAEDFLYWSKEKFGMAPFITVTHVTIACPSPVLCVMTTRDVYSSRYLDASVALGIATDAGANAFDLVYDNRSRANALKGAFGGLRRALTERRARGGLEDSLRTVKMALEKR